MLFSDPTVQLWLMCVSVCLCVFDGGKVGSNEGKVGGMGACRCVL